MAWTEAARAAAAEMRRRKAAGKDWRLRWSKAFTGSGKRSYVGQMRGIRSFIAPIGRGFKVTSEAGHRQSGFSTVADAKFWVRKNVK